MRSQSHSIWFSQAIEYLETAQNTGCAKLNGLLVKYSQDAFENMLKQAATYVLHKDKISLFDLEVKLKKVL